MRPFFVFFLLFFLWMCLTLSALADDIGITKVRLIQINDTSYLFEADIQQQLIRSISTPTFPDRFRVSKYNYDNQSGWILLQAMVTSSGAPLNSEDKILLTWTRNGVDFTAKWIDGSIYKGLYRQGLGGIKIPLNQLMPANQSILEVLQESFISGFTHFGFRGIHFLLVLALVFAVSSFKVFHYLLNYSFGQAVSLILFELGIPGFDLLFADLLVVLVIFLIGYAYLCQNKLEPFKIVLFFLGLFHGISYAQKISVPDILSIQKIQMLFGFNLSIDLISYALALLLLSAIIVLKKYDFHKRWIPIMIGSVSVFLFFMIIDKDLKMEITQSQDLSKSGTGAQVLLPAVQSGSRTSGQLKRGASKMNTPVMAYLSIEPFEVRQEILIDLNTSAKLSGFNEESLFKVPLELQYQFKERILEAVDSINTITINDKKLEPLEKSINFVRLTPAGVIIYENQEEAPFKERILGISFVYETKSLPDSIQVEWNMIPYSVESIEVSAVDPYGSFTTLLSPQENVIHWKSRFSGYQVPVLEAVEVENEPIPLISICIWIGIILVVLFFLIYKKQRIDGFWVPLLVAISFILYPFIRFTINHPLIPQWKPSKERSSYILDDLLTNVYSAFDRRDENEVYNRLALSVSGEQLTEIYLQNRKAMSFENRGGTRAYIDEVEILKINEVNRSENGGLVVDALWTVSGSVNHFGHTHYRQNQYWALVHLYNDDQTWKIQYIETIDNKRLL